MTTPTESNVHALAVDGDFDDCQARLKDMFNDFDFRDGVKLAGVNSINWGRVLAQVVYYFSSAVSLGAPDRKVSFTVPTGNFGDIFAGYIARANGAAHRRSGRGHQPERHSGPVPQGAGLSQGRRTCLHQPVDGYSGLVQL